MSNAFERKSDSILKWLNNMKKMDDSRLVKELFVVESV